MTSEVVSFLCPVKAVQFAVLLSKKYSFWSSILLKDVNVAQIIIGDFWNL